MRIGGRIEDITGTYLIRTFHNAGGKEWESKSHTKVLMQSRTSVGARQSSCAVMASSFFFILTIVLQLSIISGASDYDLIQDYFSYKKINTIIGFSCGNIESDITLTRAFNDNYVYSTFWHSTTPENLRVNFRKLANSKYYQIGIFLDLKCNSGSYGTIFSQAAKYSMYGGLHKWFILSANLSYCLEVLNDRAFSVMTDFVIAVPTSNGYTLHDVYNPFKDRNGRTNVTVLGSWYGKGKLNITLTQSKFERRSNLCGMKLKVGIAINAKPDNISLHETLLHYSMKANYGRLKCLYTLLLHMADLYNFTIELVQINTQRKYHDSGPVFNAFQKKLIDLSATPIAMKAEHLKHGDIIGPVWPIRSCFLFRTISSTKMKTAQFLKPLSVKVWYVILGTIAMATTVLMILLRLENIHSPSESYSISVLLTVGALTQQGSTFIPSHYAGRIAFLQILVFGLLILNYYSASVVSDRLKNIGEKMNDSLISLADSNLKIAVDPATYTRSFFQVPDREARYFYEKRWIKLPEASRYLPLEEGLNKVADGSLAYHAMVDSAYPYIEHSFQDRSICELTEVHLFRTTLAFYARYRSPFTELMRVGLMKMDNVGIRDRQVTRWSARKPFCPNNLLIAEPLSIHEAAPIFIFLCISLAISMSICIMENIVQWIWPKRLSTSDIGNRRLTTANICLPSLRNINLQSLKNLPFFKH